MQEQQQEALPASDTDAAGGSCTRRVLCAALLRRAGAVAACSLVTSATEAPASDAARETVLVTGATGRTGVEVTSALVACGFSPLCMFRAGRASRAAVAPGVATFECDVTDPDASERVADALRRYRVTSVICTLGFVPTFVSADDRRLAQVGESLEPRTLVLCNHRANLEFPRFVIKGPKERNSSLGLVKRASALAAWLPRSLRQWMQRRDAETCRSNSHTRAHARIHARTHTHTHTHTHRQLTTRGSAP